MGVPRVRIEPRKSPRLVLLDGAVVGIVDLVGAQGAEEGAA